MSRDWTPDEIQAASKAMKEMGYLSYEEVCEIISSEAVATTAIQHQGFPPCYTKPSSCSEKTRPDA